MHYTSTVSTGMNGVEIISYQTGKFAKKFKKSKFSSLHFNQKDDTKCKFYFCFATQSGKCH